MLRRFLWLILRSSLWVADWQDLSATIKIAEMGGHVDLFSIVPVKRSHSVCAQGGINAAKNLKGEGDTPWQHFDDTIYGGDFLANQPPVKSDVRPGAGHHRPARPHGRSVQPHARRAARLPPLRRHALQPHGLCRRYHRPAAAVRARRAGAPLRGRRQGHQVRSVGVSLRRHRRSARLPRHLRDRSAQHAGAHLPGGSGHHGDRRHRRHLRQVDELGGLHRIGAVGAVSAGRVLRQRRVHPGTSHVHSRRRQAAPDVGVGARRRRPRLGAAAAGRQARSQEHSRQRALVLPGRVVSQVRQPGAARYRDARHSQSGVRAQPRHRRPADGLSRPDAHRSQDSRPQAGRHSRDLREVCGRRSARCADEDLPRHALHHGRPVGRLRPDAPTSKACTPAANATTRSTARTAWARTR